MTCRNLLGTIVHYLDMQGDCRAAMVVEIHRNGKVDLEVHYKDAGVITVLGVVLDETKERRSTWHYLPVFEP